jgi:pyruvate dehydrogenase E1 component
MADSKLLGEVDPATMIASGQVEAPMDVDPAETSEWLGSLDYVYKSKGADRVRYLVKAIENRARRDGVEIPIETNTPYVNTIPPSKQPAYPGNRETERRIKSIVRWNAMAMVVRANKKTDGQDGHIGGGVGGHISTFASSATLYEVGYNHFFRGRGESGYS